MSAGSTDVKHKRSWRISPHWAQMRLSSCRGTSHQSCSSSGQRTALLSFMAVSQVGESCGNVVSTDLRNAADRFERFRDDFRTQWVMNKGLNTVSNPDSSCLRLAALPRRRFPWLLAPVVRLASAGPAARPKGFPTTSARRPYSPSTSVQESAVGTRAACVAISLHTSCPFVAVIVRCLPTRFGGDHAAARFRRLQP